MLNMSVIGRLVKDAEESSNYSISFTVAINFYNSVEKEQDALFIKCFINKEQNTHMHKFLTKGSLFYFNLTPIKIGVYNDKPSIMAKVNTIEFVSKKQSDSEGSETKRAPETPKKSIEELLEEEMRNNPL